MATCQVVIDTIDDYVDIDIIMMLTMLMMIPLAMTIKVISIRGRVDEAGQILEKAALMNNRTGVSKVWASVSS